MKKELSKEDLIARMKKLASKRIVLFRGLRLRRLLLRIKCLEQA